MIAAPIVQEIRRLLRDENLSQRQVALLTGVSRGTIGRIANGQRTDPPPPDPVCDEDPSTPAGPPQRCPVCGGKVHMPCRLCRLRSRLARTKKRDSAHRESEPSEESKLELNDEHRARYEQVRFRGLPAGRGEPQGGRP